MISIILVMIGGGFGAIARSAITDYFNHKFTSKLPIATLIVNLVGSFLIGSHLDKEIEDLNHSI